VHPFASGHPALLEGQEALVRYGVRRAASRRAQDTAVNKLSLVALAREQLEAARRAPNGRSARTVFGGHEHRLRQTLIALVSGQALGDHRSPGEATVQVVDGRVRLHSGGTSWDGRPGDLLLVPPAVHSLEAVDDAVVLLTVVMPGAASG
jgi:quercetin dioxygenase-like cupin family protein